MNFLYPGTIAEYAIESLDQRVKGEKERRHNFYRKRKALLELSTLCGGCSNFETPKQPEHANQIGHCDKGSFSGMLGQMYGTILLSALKCDHYSELPTDRLNICLEDGMLKYETPSAIQVEP